MQDEKKLKGRMREKEEENVKEGEIGNSRRQTSVLDLVYAFSTSRSGHSATAICPNMLAHSLRDRKAHSSAAGFPRESAVGPILSKAF
jgi:hypothetical protein